MLTSRVTAALLFLPLLGASVSVAAGSATPIATQPDLTPGPLVTTSGAPIAPGQAVISLQVQVKSGDFILGLRPDLAPKSVARVLKMVESNAYSGQKLLTGDGRFVILEAEVAPNANKLGEGSRVRPAQGLLYFDQRGERLGLTIDGASVPAGWVCIGQVQVPGRLLRTWKNPPSGGASSSETIQYLGHMRS